MTAALAEAEARLQRTVDAMTDLQAAAPSRLPGWTRAMLVTHIARNADSNARMIAAALRGEERPQYPGGPSQRSEDIEAGRGRTASVVAGDLREAASEFSGVLAAVTDWEVMVPAAVGPRTIGDRLQSRWYEVEVHHVDLDLGYEAADWPDDFVAMAWERTLGALPSRRSPEAPFGCWLVGGEPVGDGEVRGAAEGSRRDLLAWLLGRPGGPVRFDGDPAVASLPDWYRHT